jgi:predicted nuclease of predicted toxin-antitoxin system
VVALYLDEDQDPLVARQCRTRGYDVLSTNDAGMLGATDEEQLDYAAREGRALVTFNIKDFSLLHARWMEDGRSHAGIIVTRQNKRSEIGGLLRLIDNVLQLATEDDLRNSLHFLSDFDV